MPTKTERILVNLPRSFLPARRQSGLKAIAGAVGGELQQGEVSLARVLRAHWVDSADEGAPIIADLARIGSMWGLAPLVDPDGTQLETVEQFRVHLKRHVRTVLAGRVTVKGLLQVAAETLGIRIAEGDDVDVWWNRPSPFLPTAEPRGEDAAVLIFGQPAIDVRGADAQPATVRGTVDLTGGANLEAGGRLKLQVDDKGSFVIDLVRDQADLRAVPLGHVVEAINAVFPGLASAEGGFLVLRSDHAGPESRIELESVTGDASLALFGVPAHIYTGQEARAAEIRSAVDLSSGVDLRAERFLRLAVDRTHVVEVDCADPVNETTLVDHIEDAINEALGGDFASHDGGLLVLRSPVTGSQGSVFVQEPAAQNCAPVLFGEAPRFSLGSDPRPATVTSTRDLSGGVDLTERSLVKIGVDGAHPVAVNCAGADPAKTTVEEIVTNLNAGFGSGFVRTDGRRLIVSSRVSGKKGELVFSSAGDGDALQDVLGFGPRVFLGRAAVPASITSGLDLSGGVDLTASRFIGLIVDGAPLREIKLPSPAIRLPQNDPAHPETSEEPRNIRRTQLEDLEKAINDVVPGLAFATDTRIVLTSPTIGAASRLSIVPLERELRRRFVSRAAVLDEAAQFLLGFIERHAQGDDATRARLVGDVDLRFGVDLREDRWVRLAVDGLHRATIDCSGPRPQATTIDDIAGKIGDAIAELEVSGDGRVLTLASRSAGAGSRIAFEPVRARDALDLLFGIEPGEARGQNEGRVVFVGTADLSRGVELPPDARIKIAIDAVPSVDIVLNATEAPVRRTANEIVTAINQALAGAFASHDGRVVSINSRASGAASLLAFDVPGGVDVTKQVCGIPAPRLYQAGPATGARIKGQRDLPDAVDLSVARFLRIALNGQPAIVVDCAIAAPDPTAPKPSPEQIRDAINREITRHRQLTGNAAIDALAELEGRRLLLVSRLKGGASRVAFEPHVAGDARRKIFGNAPTDVRGKDGTPAVIVGDVLLTRPVDLSAHRQLLIRVDADRPVEVGVAGATPSQTTLEDVVEAINTVAPGTASSTPDRQLRLQSRSTGSASRVAVLPRRYLELVESPPVDDHLEAGPIGHGDRFAVQNTGVADATARIELASLHGTVGAALVNHRSGLKVVLDLAMRAGDRALIAEVDGVLQVTLVSETGERRVLRDDEVRVEKVVAEPFGGVLALGRGTNDWTFLECVGPRFDTARSDEERYPGAPCQTVGMFDIGRLDGTTACDENIYALQPMPPPSARVRFEWSRHQPGAFELRLPAELPALFGGRFNEARFGLGVELKTVEIQEIGQPLVETKALVASRDVHDGVVFGPPGDASHFEKVLGGSRLLEVDTTRTNVPLGFKAAEAPFRKPRFLTMGELDQRARLFVIERASDTLIELIAADVLDPAGTTTGDPGQRGTQISVSLRPGGPGQYLLEVGFPGDRFECGRLLVLGPAEGAETTAAPGILQAKAAGVRAHVSRIGTNSPD